MPKRDKFKKQVNQPSVVILFTGNASAFSSTPVPSDKLEVTPMQPESSEGSPALNALIELDLSKLNEDNRSFTPVNNNRRRK